MMKRRRLLKSSMAATTLALAAGVGLLKPVRLIASTWPDAALTADDVDDAIRAIFGEGEIQESDEVTLSAPIQAENGGVVPIQVSTRLPVERIAIVAEKNPVPMVSVLDVHGSIGGVYSVRIKMSETSPVHCIVRSGGALFRTSQEIKVTVGGCGG